MVNSKITRLTAGLGLIYLVSCGKEPTAELAPLELTIENTDYTLLVDPATHNQLRMLTSILLDKTNKHGTNFMYDSTKKILTPVCIPDSTLNKTLSEIDENQDLIINSGELFYYYFTDQN